MRSFVNVTKERNCVLPIATNRLDFVRDKKVRLLRSLKYANTR